jgi:hypothetical protein
MPAMAQMHIACAQQGGTATAGTPGNNELTVVQNGQTSASIVVAADAGKYEKQAAEDLQKYIEMMTGAKPALGNAAGGNNPIFYVGSAALKADPKLQDALNQVKKKNPTLRADAVVVKREGNKVLLAGTNDESNYFAVSWLLQQWGCRWYLPTDFGEVVPTQSTLKIGTLNYVYAPPFEIRHYWLSWNGDATGADEFKHRNFMNNTSMVGMGHALGQYTSDIAPPGKSVFNVPFSDPKTAEHVASKIEADYAAGKDISLAIEDGNFVNDSASDKALQFEYDRYTLKPSMTDAMLTLYNNVGKILREKYPNSKAHIGGMAYANVTLPPKKVTHLEPNIVMWIAPIDIDPNHGMDDPRSPPRQEYAAWMKRWAELTEGRLAIYDYDQGMLVWRDLPNPSQQAFVQDVKHYRDAGILGVGTESRGAMATTFLNLYFRGQLMWNPDANLDQLTAEFYPKFYGPAAAPMADYWNAIFDAWKNTIVTEHEYMAAPAIYTPELVSRLQKDLEQAEKLAAPLAGNTGRNEQLYTQRMKFTRLSFDVLQNYMAMVNAAAAENDYAKAAAFGAKALAAREELTNMNGTFTTYKRIGENGPAWFPGDVDFMKELAAYTDGTKGTLVAKTPLQWSFHRDAPVPADWTYTGMEGEKPNGPSTLATQEPTAANGWTPLRTDIYLQGQGILAPDGQSYTGHYWYQTALDLKADQTGGKVHLMFPGLFNEAWLYVNGEQVAHRNYSEPWWLSDYKFQWDVDLTGKLKPGKNVIAIRGFNPHHFGGIFRRPFLYRATQ